MGLSVNFYKTSTLKCPVMKTMSDLEKYITRRKKHDTEFASGYDSGYEAFRFGAILKNSDLKKGYQSYQKQ